MMIGCFFAGCLSAGSVFQQLCRSLQVTPDVHLRSKLGDVVWRAK
jgi:hypothetical protein